MRTKHPQPFSVQTQEIRNDLTVKIQNDCMRLLDHTEERPNIQNKGLGKHFIETSHTHSANLLMKIYTYGMHTNSITQSNLARIHI